MPSKPMVVGGSRVAVEPIQRVVLQAVQEGMTWSGIASALGWMCSTRQQGRPTKADVSRLQRRLGLRADRGTYHIATMDYDMAVRIVEACNYDPVDAGL